jgi:ribonuclease-3 family protein
MIKRKDIEMMSPLVWAYMGDSVYEQYVREHVIFQGIAKNGAYHKKAIKYVSANAQVKILKALEGFLTDEEQEIVKRGRNSQPHSHAKNADIVDYKWATGFEALVGYLFLTKQKARLDEIIKRCFQIVDET